MIFDIISAMEKGRIRRVGHVPRLPEERTMKKVFKNIPEEKNQERDGSTMLKII